MERSVFGFAGVPVVPSAADVQGDLVSGSDIEHFFLNVGFAQVGNRFLARQRFAAQQGQDLLHRLAATGCVNDERLEILGGEEVLADVLLNGSGNAAAGSPVVFNVEGALGRILEVPNVENGIAVETFLQLARQFGIETPLVRASCTAIRIRPTPWRALHNGL